MRLFVSVDLDDLADGVADAQSCLPTAGGLRPVAPSDAHVTLTFLGETAPNRVETAEHAVATAVSNAGVDPFDLTVGGFGVFPSVDHIGAVRAGVRSGATAPTRLHEAIERETTAHGFDPDPTSSRLTSPSPGDDARGTATTQRVVREADPTLGTLPVTELRLVESALARDGPVHETVARFPL